MRATASYMTHCLIQDFSSKPGLVQRFQSEPDAVLEEYGVPEAERGPLKEGSPPALASIGVHPILQVHFNIANNPMLSSLLGAGTYFERMGANRVESQ